MEQPGTIDKAIDVLFHLHREGGPSGVTAIGRALDMPKSSVHRLLAPLLRRGLVERDDRGRYRPGVGLVALGLGVLDREPTVAAAHSVLEACAGEVGQTFFLVAARAGRLMVLDKAEGTGFLRFSPRVGAEVPAHATAVGKLYLAFAPDAISEEGRSDRTRFTERTLLEEDALAREVERVGRTGLAHNEDEWIPGLSVIAAPIHAGARMAGAVALALPSPAVASHGRDDLETRVREAAEKITARLSGSAPA